MHKIAYFVKWASDNCIDFPFNEISRSVVYFKKWAKLVLIF